MRDPMSEDSGAPPAPAVHRLSAWLRRRGRTRPSAPAGPPEGPADPPAPPPPSRLRPQPEDDASVYPLF
ncbi:hypothetical protein HZZ00_13215 [Streptomyces sp. NEAU-sy36]|uniref:hypothetical protein n=1 Tax=unclassified Streptomyces TaxID=2593676 RepID=UPI0015D58EFB|nr:MULTISPECIES: hypothetical protein [unclassified Streptomyces]QLJ01894.1 hypothetical protein HZZ00_13215 [Streptomyces sp. NEAU-sy36]